MYIYICIMYIRNRLYSYQYYVCLYMYGIYAQVYKYQLYKYLLYMYQYMCYIPGAIVYEHMIVLIHLFRSYETHYVKQLLIMYKLCITIQYIYLLYTFLYAHILAVILSLIQQAFSRHLKQGLQFMHKQLPYTLYTCRH